MSTETVTLEEPKADLATENARLREALDKINTIRNSIIGLQTMNWSEHIYPLVAALEDAGITGMSYTEARGMFGTMLERTNSAEARIEALVAALAEVKDMVCGDKHPRWSDADATTRARGRIADLCDAALPHP